MERTTIKLFQTVSPSVVSVFARKDPQTLFSQGEEGIDVQTGTGIIWDTAGHVITNYHVLKGSDQFAASSLGRVRPRASHGHSTEL
jgi:2-alkenal reductase